ncbi:GTP-binding protein REM 1-like isoform X2 [Centruroides sculpturatus]|uniref:GTP-binding protein REM 1-like isoform X2 n=1 Tax=Centruroides sculpturatus TaxID=218467 RepID=UPI000C6CE061|nr:GTP-binding protein REM 1-like isoform X2 [Centruroides sculpturatus]
MTLDIGCIEPVPRSMIEFDEIVPHFISNEYRSVRTNNNNMASFKSSCKQSKGRSVNRSQSVKTVRCPQNSTEPSCRFRSRISSTPSEDNNTRPSPRASSLPLSGEDADYYRLRNFAVTPKGVINRGDSFRSKPSSISSSPSSASSPRSESPSSPDQEVAPCISRQTSYIDQYKVLVMGAPDVGKSSITRQFMTSEYISAYDSSQDENEKSVTVVLNGQESEMIFLEIPCDEDLVQMMITSSNIDAYVVVYSVTSRRSFIQTRKLLEQLQRWDGSSNKPLILVGNKTDLARLRTVTTENGRSLATEVGCKFIETSAGINHQLDELLVGILSQIRLKTKHAQKVRRRQIRGHTTDLSGNKARGIIRRILKKACIRSKSCDNLHVL